jgi:serine/threonine protein kinase
MASSSPPVAGALPPGAKLGRYEVLGMLSIGGMAEIYLARTEGIAGFEKVVVVKRMLPHLALSPEYVNMFLAEARLGAMLDHPNVVGVHDIGEHDGNYYYAMEYVRGPDLRRIMRAAGDEHGPVPVHCGIAVGIGLCAGLEHAHELADLDGQPLGVVHRDVSLSNVLVSFDGTVKVTDFGVAKLTLSDHKTRAGTLKGKVGYMSPEQVRGETLDRRSDLFAVGIILYELTTGRRLFRPRRSELEVLQRIAKENIEPPSLILPDYPYGLEDVVMRALARDREMRYQTARELQRDLEAVMLAGRHAATASELGEYVRGLVPPTQVLVHEKTPAPVRHVRTTAVTLPTIPTGTPPRQPEPEPEPTPPTRLSWKLLLLGLFAAACGATGIAMVTGLV